MEMQEYSWYLLDKMQEEELTLTHTRQLFIDKYGNSQVDVFDSSYEGWYHELLFNDNLAHSTPDDYY